MKKILFLLLVAFSLVSCAKNGEPVPTHSMDDYNVQFLFECDGVKIYRFDDCGRSRYFAVGNGKMTDSTYKVKSGKSSMTRDDTVIQ